MYAVSPAGSIKINDLTRPCGGWDKQVLANKKDAYAQNALLGFLARRLGLSGILITSWLF
jgi:hypothetical protein